MQGAGDLCGQLRKLKIEFFDFFPVTFRREPQREPAGDNTAGIAMLKQAVKLAETFSDAAVKHQTVGMAAHLGARKPKASLLDAREAPLQALLTLMMSGIGNLFGTLGTGWWRMFCQHEGHTNWAAFWGGMTAMTSAVFIFFAFAYQGRKRESPTESPVTEMLR